MHVVVGRQSPRRWWARMPEKRLSPNPAPGIRPSEVALLSPDSITYWLLQNETYATGYDTSLLDPEISSKDHSSTQEERTKYTKGVKTAYNYRYWINSFWSCMYILTGHVHVPEQVEVTLWEFSPKKRRWRTRARFRSDNHDTCYTTFPK
jgi:hypothetical protein